MKTARVFIGEWLADDELEDEDMEALSAALEARDREVRAAAFNMAADLFGALVRHSVDGYVRLTSVRNQLLALVAKERDQ